MSLIKWISVFSFGHILVLNLMPVRKNPKPTCKDRKLYAHELLFYLVSQTSQQKDFKQSWMLVMICPPPSYKNVIGIVWCLGCINLSHTYACIISYLHHCLRALHVFCWTDLKHLEYNIAKYTSQGCNITSPKFQGTKAWNNGAPKT